MARILLIDDDPQILSSMKNVLQDDGFEVVTAANGREGLQQYRLQPAELVITDILMPEMDGLEVIERLTRQYPHVKIMVMSGGNGDRDFLQAAELLGASRALAKPFGPEALLSAVHEEVNGHACA